MKKMLDVFWELQATYKALDVDLKKELEKTTRISFLLRRKRIIALYNKKSACFYELMNLADELLKECEKETNEESQALENEDFGNCEVCGCQLDYEPSGGWGVGYVCIPCAKQLRGEYE